MQHYAGGGIAVVSTTTAHGIAIHTNRFASSPNALTISSTNAVTCNTSFTNNSDASLKTNVGPASTDRALQVLKAVEPKVYKRIDLDDDSFRIGFLAQDFAAVLPTEWSNIVGATEEVAAHTDDQGNEVPAKPSTLTLDYARLVCCLWSANRSMLSRIEKLEAAAAL